jgi:hypothetical protein
VDGIGPWPVGIAFNEQSSSDFVDDRPIGHASPDGPYISRFVPGSGKYQFPIIPPDDDLVRVVQVELERVGREIVDEKFQGVATVNFEGFWYETIEFPRKCLRRTEGDLPGQQRPSVSIRQLETQRDLRRIAGCPRIPQFEMKREFRSGGGFEACRKLDLSLNRGRIVRNRCGSGVERRQGKHYR